MRIDRAHLASNGLMYHVLLTLLLFSWTTVCSTQATSQNKARAQAKSRTSLNFHLSFKLPPSPGNLQSRASLGFVTSTGKLTSDQSLAVKFAVVKGQLVTNGTAITANPSDQYIPFAVHQGGQGSISQTWTTTTGLSWSNVNFTNGKASFCFGSNSYVYLVLKSTPAACRAVTPTTVPPVKKSSSTQGVLSSSAQTSPKTASSVHTSTSVLTSTPGTSTPGTSTPGIATLGTSTLGTSTLGTSTLGTTTPGSATPGTSTIGSSTTGYTTSGLITPGSTTTSASITTPASVLLGNAPIPATVLSSASGTPLPTHVPCSLPADQYTSGSGDGYNLQCNINYAGYDIDVTQQNDLSACMDRCSIFNRINTTDSGNLCAAAVFYRENSTCTLRHTILYNALRNDTRTDAGWLFTFPFPQKPNDLSVLQPWIDPQFRKYFVYYSMPFTGSSIISFRFNTYSACVQQCTLWNVSPDVTLANSCQFIQYEPATSNCTLLYKQSQLQANSTPIDDTYITLRSGNLSIPRCPWDYGLPYHTQYRDTYNVECGYRLAAEGNLRPSFLVPNLVACINDCSQWNKDNGVDGSTPCVAAQYDQLYKLCDLKSNRTSGQPDDSKSSGILQLPGDVVYQFKNNQAAVLKSQLKRPAV